MSSPASASASDSAGGVLTQVYPPQRAFILVHPLAVGTVQIMIGVMVFLFGLVDVIVGLSLGASSSILLWGPAFYITSGSLTVAAGKYFSRCLVNTTLAFNVVASVVSLVAVFLYAIDASGVFASCYDNSGSNYLYCDLYLTRMKGFAGVLAVFNALEFFVSITVALFACATCNHDNQVTPGNDSPPLSLFPTWLHDSCPSTGNDHCSTGCGTDNSCFDSSTGCGTDNSYFDSSTCCGTDISCCV